LPKDKLNDVLFFCDISSNFHSHNLSPGATGPKGV